METQLKQRLVGAAVLVALAVIFLPMLVKGPAPGSGVSNLPLTMPDAPDGGFGTRDLPLVTPQASIPSALDENVMPTVDTATAPEAGPARTQADNDRETATVQPAAAPTVRLPASVAGGNYAVSFGAYGSSANARTVIARLREAELPGYRESTTVSGKPAWRVRIGPYATRADAEAARIAAEQVPNDVTARVVALDAEAATTKPAVGPVKPEAAPAKPTAETAMAVEPPRTPAAEVKPAAAADVGFAVQVGAFSKAADATALRDRMRGAGFSAFTEAVQTDKGTLTRVRAGPVLSRADADQLKSQLKSKLGLDGIVGSHP